MRLSFKRDEKAREWVKSNWHLINHKYDLAEEKP